MILLDDIKSQVNDHILSMYSEILELKYKHEQDVENCRKRCKNKNKNSFCLRGTVLLFIFLYETFYVT